MTRAKLLLTGLGLLTAVGCALINSQDVAATTAILEIVANPTRYAHNSVTIACKATEVSEGSFLCTDDTFSIVVMGGSPSHEGARVTVRGKVFRQPGTLFFCQDGTLGALLCAGSDPPPPPPRPKSDGDGKTSPAYDTGFRPVEVGRHYVGTFIYNVAKPSRVIQMRMEMTALNQGQVTVKVAMLFSADTWTGTYDPDRHTLALKAEPADFIDLQYSNGGTWTGNLRLVTGRDQRNQRIYATLPVQLSAEAKKE